MGFAQYVHGGVTYPLATSTGNTLLRDADPSLFYALDYFQSVIKSGIEARFIAECSAISFTAGGAAITSAVAYKLPYDPTNYLQEQQIKFPLLAVFREEGKFSWEVQSYMGDACIWTVLWVLPPMTSAQRERIDPIRRSVGQVLSNRIENMFDAGYSSGVQVWQQAGLEEIYLDKEAYGSFDIPSGSLVFPAWKGTLVVKERDMPIPDAATDGVFGGLDLELDLVSDGSPPIAITSLVETFPDPTTLGSGSLVCFARADKGIVAGADASLVGSWTDQSAASNTLAAATQPNQPSIASDNVTAQKCVRFDGNQACLTATVGALANDGGKTIIVAFRLWDVLSRSSLALVTNGAASGTLALEANTTGTAGGKFGLLAGGSTFDTQFTTDVGWHIAVIRVSASTNGTSIVNTTKVQIDDTPAVLTVKSGTGLWQSLASSSQLALGGLSTDLTHTDAHADIGVLLTYSSNLSDADVASAVAFVKQWLANEA